MNVIIMISAMKSVGFFLNAFSFLELIPVYKCYKDYKTSLWYECNPTDFCGKNIRHEPNWDDSETIYNFIMQFDMEC